MQTINVASIEKELNALWGNIGKEDESGVTRACVLNLLVFTSQQQATSELDELLTEVTAVHPSRAMLVVADREAAEAGMSAQVISRCTLPTAAHKQVCCEQVTIHASGNQINEVHSAVQSLLLSDLPVYLWWRDTPRLTDKAFSRLVDMASRVIIDSARFADPHGDLVSFSVLLRDRPRWAAFSDLNWSRLTAWRALTSSFFDIAEYHAQIEGITSIQIEYGASRENPAMIGPRAMLLGGWLASRLGFTINPAGTTRSAGAITFEFRKNARIIHLRLIASNREGLEFDHLRSVNIQAVTPLPETAAPSSPSAQPASGASSSTSSLSDQSRSTVFHVEKTEDGTKLQTSVQFNNESRPGRVLGYFRSSESELLGHELEIFSHDHVYEQAMLCAGEMLIALVQA